jgi:micrococcal nuclease
MKMFIFAAILISLLSLTAAQTTRAQDVVLPEGEDATLVRVIDGDTIRVRIGKKQFNLRYIGIDAPEWNKQKACFGREATAINKSLLKGTLRLEKDITDKDSFGRLLRYVWLADGRMVNEEVVKAGAAVAQAYPPDLKHQERLNLANDTARHLAAGLWTACAAPAPAPEPAPTPVVAAANVEPNISAYSCTGPDLDCRDFSSQAAAQKFWNSCGGQAGGHNPHRLDGNDKDGRVCESLP